MCKNEMTHIFEPAVKCPAPATLVAGAHLNDLLYACNWTIKVDSRLINFIHVVVARRKSPSS